MFENYMDLVSTQEAQEMLNIGANTLYILLDSGEVKGFRCGRVWKIPKAAIEEYILRKSGLNSTAAEIPRNHR